MPRYSVTRNGGGHSFGLYSGPLRWRAEEVYNCAPAEPGTVVVLTDHEAKGAGRVLRSSDQLVIHTCSKCRRPITGELVPAKDSATGQDVCDDCTRAQRHLHRAAAGA